MLFEVLVHLEDPDPVDAIFADAGLALNGFARLRWYDLQTLQSLGAWQRDHAEAVRGRRGEGNY